MFNPEKINGSVSHESSPQQEKLPKKEHGHTQIRAENLDKKIAIQGSKNFIDLFKAIDNIGGLQGSEKFYKVQELKDAINKVRSGEQPIDVVTRTDGLRQRVDELLKIENLVQRMEGGQQKDQLFRQIETAAPKGRAGSMDHMFSFRSFVEGIEKLSKLPLSQEETKKILELIKSYPSGTRDMKDVAKLSRIQPSLEKREAES